MLNKGNGGGPMSCSESPRAKAVNMRNVPEVINEESSMAAESSMVGSRNSAISFYSQMSQSVDMPINDALEESKGIQSYRRFESFGQNNN